MGVGSFVKKWTPAGWVYQGVGEAARQVKNEVSPPTAAPPPPGEPPPPQDPTRQTGGYETIAKQQGYTPPPAPVAPPAPGTVADRTGTVAAPPVIDTTTQDKSAARQNTSIDLLEKAAKGGTPSVAENSISAAMTRAANQRMGMAAQARGGDALALQREASIGIGQDALQSGQEGAMARAAEMTGARGALATAVGDQRGQDIGVMTWVGGEASKTSNANADRAVQLAGGDQALAGQILISNADRDLKKYGIDIQAEIDKQGLRQQWEIAKQANDINKINAIIQGLATAAPLLLAASDEGLKSNVSQVGDDELDAFARKISEAVYSYDRKDTGQHEVGTMAQEVAGAGPLGREVTGDAAPGVKGVDYGRLALLMSAAALRSQKERV